MRLPTNIIEQRMGDIEDNISQDLKLLYEYKRQEMNNLSSGRSTRYSQDQQKRYYNSVVQNLREYLQL